MEEVNNSKFQKLKKFNIIAAVLHLFQGIAMLVIANDFALPLTRSYLVMDEVTEKLVLESTTIVDVRLGPMIASFLLMSALAHFLIATVLNKKYVEGLQKGMNQYRWFEYSISASVMIVAIAMLVGIYDIGLLLLIFSMNAIMIFGGYLMERVNQNTDKTDWSPFILGSFAGLVPWIVIGIFLLGAGAGGDGGPPDFVYFIYASIALTFNIFALNMVLQYRKKGKWEDYLHGEYMYIILSLVAKSLLAWQVFGGTLRPD